VEMIQAHNAHCDEPARMRIIQLCAETVWLPLECVHASTQICPYI